MKLTLGWLNDHLDHQASLEEVTQSLTMIGLEVEEIDNPKERLKNFVTALVETCEPHPDADRLKVCHVNNGSDVFQVVCGAKNVRSGLKGIFAPAGTHIPGTGLDLTKTTIRGVESQGMLCSERELMLSDEHQGIIDLDEKTPIGESFAKLYGLDDPIIDLKLTPNRGDCFSIRGIARDLAASGLGKLKPLDELPKQGSFNSPLSWQRDAGLEKDCPYVTGVFLRHLKNKESPLWMQQRLKALGQQTISAIVDVTNYIMLDFGRPLHAFDADHIKGDKLILRKAKKDEQFKALDGKIYRCDETMTAITDSETMLSLAGVMGGIASGCTLDTSCVFLEAALFDPMDIAKTGRSLHIESGARQRFERGIDPLFTDEGLARAARLIMEICGGEVSYPTALGKPPDPKGRVILPIDKLTKRMGCSIPTDQAANILENLGFTVTTKKDTIEAIIPSWRPDISTDACLSEEIMRIYGYDKIPALPLKRPDNLPVPLLSPKHRSRNRARRVLAASGFYETVSFSFTSEKLAKAFGGGEESLKVLNPISSELSAMRPSNLANLLLALKSNRDAGVQNLALFESGPCFGEVSGEFWSIAGIRSGLANARHWAEVTSSVDAYHVKADLYATLEAFGVPKENLRIDRKIPEWFHPGRSAGLALGKNILGFFGEIHPAICASFNIKDRILGFECFCDRIPDIGVQQRRKAIKKNPFQPVHRDFAFLFDKDSVAQKIIQAIRAVDRTMISEVSIFDLYAPIKTHPDKKSIALTVILQPVEKTLTDADIEQISKKIITAAEKEGGLLRGF